MSGMQLSNFEAASSFEDGDRVKASDMAGIPLLVYVVDKRENIVTKHSPDGADGLFLDILNMNTQEVFLGVLWMNKQVVDNLTRYVGSAVAIKLEWRKSKTQNDYLAIVPLEGAEADVAQQWVNTQPNLFADARKARDMKSYEEIRGSSVTAIQPGVNTAKNNAPAAPPAPPSAPPAPAAPSAPPAAPTPPAPAAPAATAPATPVPAPPAPPAPAAPTPAPAAPAPQGDGDLPF